MRTRIISGMLAIIMLLTFLPGMAVKASRQIFVDKGSQSKVKETYLQARQTLRSGMSMAEPPK